MPHTPMVMPHSPVSCHTLPYHADPPSQKHLAKLISTRYATLLQRAAFTPATASFSAAAAASSSAVGGAGAAAGAGDDAATAAIDAAAAAAPLVGRRVRVEGLAARPELNGWFGDATAYDAAGGRCRESIEGGVPVLLRPDNLTALPTKDETLNARAAAEEQHRLDVGMKSPEAHRLAVCCRNASNRPPPLLLPPTCTPRVSHPRTPTMACLGATSGTPHASRWQSQPQSPPKAANLPTTSTHTWHGHAPATQSAEGLQLYLSCSLTHLLTHLLTYSLTLLAYPLTNLGGGGSAARACALYLHSRGDDGRRGWRGWRRWRGWRGGGCGRRCGGATDRAARARRRAGGAAGAQREVRRGDGVRRNARAVLRGGRGRAFAGAAAP